MLARTLLFIASLAMSLEDPFDDLAGLERAAEAIPLPQPEALDFDSWRERIRPRDEDLRWARIPWIDSFAAGVQTADRERKPVLFWAMNGHPLGCT